MAEPTQVVFTYKEVAEALIKQHGIHEGLWGLYLEFGLAAGNVATGPNELTPTAFVGVAKIGLQRFEEATNLTVDAAEVNPLPKTSRATKGKKKVESIICNKCNFEIATVYEKEDDQKELVIHRKFSLQVVDKEKNLGSVTCPNCGNVMPTDLNFWTRF